MVSSTTKSGRKGSPHYVGSAYPAVPLTRLGLYDTSSIARKDAVIVPRSRNISFFVPSDKPPEAATINLNLPKVRTRMQPIPQTRRRSRSTTPLPTDRETRSRSRSSSPAASPPDIDVPTNSQRDEHSGVQRSRSIKIVHDVQKPKPRTRSRSSSRSRIDKPSMGSRSQSRSLSPSASPPHAFTNSHLPEPSGVRRSKFRSASPFRTSVQDDLKKAERKTHKCRGRTTSIAWFEIQSLSHLDKPPPAANKLRELEDGDLLLNWLDSTQCQVWRFTQKKTDVVGQWRSLVWGEKCDLQDSHRFVVTEKGLPSFVAESTWRKKYKPQSPKIVA